MKEKLRACAILFAALLLLSSAAAETVYVTRSLTVSKGDSKFSNMTYDINGMTKATQTVVLNIADAQITNLGLTFAGFKNAPDSAIPALNMSMANTQVTDTTITLQDYVPRYSQLFFSNTKGAMSGTTPLFAFTDTNPQYYVIINIVDTNVSWPESDAGGDLLRIGKERALTPMYNSAVYITRANAYNAANIWNVVSTLQTSIYFVNVVENSMIAVDYVNCYNCKNAFVYSTYPKTPAIVGSAGCYVRYSNCTQTGGKPFYAATNPQTFSFGPQNGNIVFSGITTDGPFFQFPAGCYGQVKRYTMLALMHIKAASSGIVRGTPFPYYLREGFPTIVESHIFMGNVTFGSKRMSTSADYTDVFLRPKYIVNEYSRFIEYGQQHYDRYTADDYVYSPNDYTAAFCAMGGGVASIGIEELGNTANGGKLWTRPKCMCKSGFWAPYCTYVYDPLLYYAGYTFDPMWCRVENCTQCWWGQSQKCTECDTGFMLYPETWGCVPNLCGECPTDDGKIYTYTEGVCVENTVENCATVNVDGVCVACNESYSLYNGVCVLCNVENCALCSSTNFCKQCNTDQAYNVDSTGQCAYCGDNCKTCTSNGCTDCVTGYSLTASGACRSVCTLAGCTTCATSTTCAVCDAGLTRTATGQCSCNIDHCETCFADKCFQCADGYYYNILNYTCDTIISSSANASQGVHVTLLTALLYTLTIILAASLL